jgi:hypothetical protein
MLRSFVAVVALVVAPVAARAADEENPFKSAKVGDYATYTMTTKGPGISLTGTITQKITKKTDKEATLEITSSIEADGKTIDLPVQTQTIDLTKPFDPTKGTGQLPAGTEAKVEKGKEGKEKIKVNGKEYDSTWTTYTMKAKVMEQNIEADVKAWMAKDVPTAIVKMTMTTEILGQKVEMVMELKETGNKK